MGETYDFEGPGRRVVVPEGLARWKPAILAAKLDMWRGRIWRGVRVDGVAWLTNGHVALRGTKVGDVAPIDERIVRAVLADGLKRRRSEAVPRSMPDYEGVRVYDVGALTVHAGIVGLVEATLPGASWWTPRKHDAPAHVLSARGRLDALVMGRGPTW
jgi:hypothetical protein